MTESDRIQRIRNKTFEVEKLMTRLSELVVELHDLNCDAAFKYETDGPDHGNLVFIHSIQYPATPVH